MWFMAACCTFHLQAQIMTTLPSESAGSQGLAVQIIAPPAPRYAAGAPVAVQVPGGFTGNGLPSAGTGLDKKGLIEINFSWPGLGNAALNQRSGGAYDTRGLGCLKALRDVLLFAMNRKADRNGKKLSDLTGAIPPLAANVGMIGMSNVGNATLCAAGMYADTLSSLAWIVNWESPVGDGMPGAECGMVNTDGASGQAGNPLVNPAYDDSTGRWNLETLAYSDTVSVAKGHISTPGSSLRGGLFFDINKNGLADWGVDFVVMPVQVSELKDTVVYYSERLIGAAAEKHLIPLPVPGHIAARKTVEEFWSYRLGEKWIPAIVQKIRDMMFIVVAFNRDHVQSAPDKPHVLIQYEGFRSGNGRFMRLNPDRSYVEAFYPKGVQGVPDNDAFVLYDHVSIRGRFMPNVPDSGAIDPSGGIPTNSAVTAAACELSDRTQYSVTDAQLSDVITAIHERGTVPAYFALVQNHPNPFNGSTAISLRLECSGWTEMFVCNTRGGRVKTLLRKRMDAGSFSTVWDGTDDGGNAVTSGLYLCVCKSGPSFKTIKMVYTK
jgi:hypothetical protein